MLHELLRAVERAGTPGHVLLRAGQLEPEQLERPDFRPRRSDALDLCGVALELTQDPAFGLHWGEWLTENAFDVVSHLIAHASSLRQALEALAQFGQLVSDETGLELLERGDRAELRCDCTEHAAPVRRLVAEMVTQGLLRLVQQFHGRRARVVRVWFDYPAPAYRQEYARVFGGAEHFEQPFTGLVFPRELLDAPSARRDEELYATLSHLAERRLLRLSRAMPYSTRVRSLLLRQRAPHRMGMEEVARQLGVSVRSLRRRLGEEGQTYLELANQASAELARQLLVDEQRTIKETAHRMGFSNASSFHRAFRRWTGTTPSAFCAQR